MTQINQIQEKIFLILGVLLKKDHNTRITEIENKIPSIGGIARNFALTAVENKMPNVSNLD